MNNKTPNYGNWVPKKMLILLIVLTLVFVSLSFLPVHVIVQVIFGFLAVVFLLILLYFYWSYHVFGRNGGAFQKEMINLVVDKLPWDGQGNILDIGTGAGPLAISVAKKYPDAKVTGIDYWGKNWDYAEEMCKRNAATEGVGDRVTFQKASAASLPFDDREFNAAVSNFVFHEVRNVKDKREVVREALRVVKKGGMFSFQDLYLSKTIYREEIDDLLETIRRWGIEELHFADTADFVEIPGFLRVPWMLGNIGTIYGKK